MKKLQEDLPSHGTSKVASIGTIYMDKKIQSVMRARLAPQRMMEVGNACTRVASEFPPDHTTQAYEVIITSSSPLYNIRLRQTNNTNNQHPLLPQNPPIHQPSHTMSSGASGSDEKISAAKIDPLASETKANVPHDQSSRGAVGSDRNIDQARIDPIGGAGKSCPASIMPTLIVAQTSLTSNFALTSISLPTSHSLLRHSKPTQKS